MEPSAVPSAAEPFSGKLTGTRRDFIRGIAAAGASTATIVALERAGVIDLFADEALAHGRGRNAFSNFTAIAPSAADAVEVPPGFRADVLITWGDVFRGKGRRALRYGFNNDFLAFFPLKRKDEGLLFVNHEYPDPFFLHGYKPNGSGKNAAQVQEEQDAVGNSILHIKRDRHGQWKVVSPSVYNRRIYGDRPDLEMTGPLRGAPGIGTSAHGSLGNCSGGITPWGTALSCEENYDGYGTAPAPGIDFFYGWHLYGGQPEDAEYEFNTFKKYGWVCEHDPYDPSSVGRKHTALGRFRHENTAFRHEPGKKFVLYMGDDRNNEGIYKFVSDRKYSKHSWSNRKILEAGTLYVARWEPEGRRRFAAPNDPMPVTATEGTGRWVKVEVSELDDTAARLRARLGLAEWDTHYATNRPEDLEVAEDGTVFIALTNNTSAGVNDLHGSVRRLREKHNDPEASEFTWKDYAAGGDRARGGAGFSSPDNLVLDKAGNVWVVTDISTSRINVDPRYAFHANNAMFMVPTRGPNKGVAFRFANAPTDAELTGPYFSPDEDTLFLNVQHPGELTSASASSVFGQEVTYTSWWPEGNKTANDNPATPRPSTIAISRASRHDKDASRFIPPPPE